MIELKRTAQERLLGRRVDAILTTTDSGGFAGRRVLITGGGGSVGSELARDLRELTQAVRVQRPIEVEVALDGRTIHAHLLLLEILNIARLGPGVQLADGVDPSDGFLDVVLIEEAHREQLVAYLEALQADPGAPTPFPAIRTTSVRVTAGTQPCAR